MLPDDSALFHGGEYDPAKAREYYLRTRELKGRKKGSAPPPAKGRPAAKATVTKLSTKQKAATTQAKIAALKKRLETLRDALAELVAAAKKRSGVDPKDTKGGKGSGSTSTSKLTPKQKKQAAARSKEYYEKHKDKTPDEQIKALEAQIKSIKARIKAAIADAKKKPAKKSKSKTASKGR